MGIKIRKERGQKSDKRRRRQKQKSDYVEVGRGDHCVMTINRHDGSIVVQRFTSAEEAQAQHERNVAADKPLVGVTELN
ncbi:hypothetical protein FIV42_22495 [Persicimonas caeni]|uniref:Uncharacterized protein n=1 Tax=Persicimonas caeni TaxID=2292766 RepID=A0A4Y6PYL7_PERCE|nr:hypothetical protein [Persicimonas caeni]QDG53411.1 hypothetical protein FIV42_22495 [Persicimonas caeni]QED34632.1 hypothetical protein FRD00_22490 [Persicimonas caeni]